MNRVKEIQDKEKAPSLNVEASKRFVKSALWKAAQSKQPVESEGIVFPNLAYAQVTHSRTGRRISHGYNRASFMAIRIGPYCISNHT